MRLWSIHPTYLDTKGLAALWREGLLAQQVLLGNTRGYRHHPQLVRFRKTGNPVGAIATYLRTVADEAKARGYRFDRRKIANKRFNRTIAVTSGQLEYEFRLLKQKLIDRNREVFDRLAPVTRIQAHPVFRIIKGDVESWEVVPKRDVWRLSENEGL